MIYGWHGAITLHVLLTTELTTYPERKEEKGAGGSRRIANEREGISAKDVGLSSYNGNFNHKEKKNSSVVGREIVIEQFF